MSQFIHLHTHSHYSLLSALPKIKELVQAAKDDGQDALALTDNGALYGAVEFYQACVKADVKPLIGVDFYVAIRSHTDKEAGVDNRRHRLILLAENNEGYKHLIKLVSISHVDGFYYKPRIDHALMKQHAKGLIAILPSFSSEVSSVLKTGGVQEAETLIATYKKIYGEKNVFLEVTHHPEIDGHEKLIQKIIELGKKTNTPLVAAHDTYYLDRDDRAARETLVSIQGNMGFAERNTLTSNQSDFSFITQAQAQEYFKNLPEALANTIAIAKRCTVDIELGTWLFPEYEIEDGATPEETLRKIVEAGLKERSVEETQEVRERIEFELNTINTKGYAAYFLVVGDLLRHAHENGILTTIRGSVAGSLVTYLAGITNINPLEYGLPFERFLNPDRPSAPDIDMDFADDRRDEVIEYAREKYGHDNVAQIGTFGTMMARGAVRDTARGLGYDYTTGDAIAKLIPMGSQGFPMTIDQALEQEPDLQSMYNSDEDAQTIIDMARKIEGCARHIGVHAAGVVISPRALTEDVPLQRDPKGGEKLITQYDMYSVGEDGIGLLKFDFLGLKNLAVLADAVERVKKLYGEDIDIENIPLDDHKTFDMLARGETMGVFQMAGAAMTGFLKDLKPTSIHDINAMIALYRPGPMKNIPQYIARKHGEEPVTYYHPKMERFLEKSYGILVYQDDLMSVALDVAGYTWKTVDTFRKAIGKKIPAEMAKQHDIFVSGCQEHAGMTEQQAEGLWDLFEPFQGYGFNKAHAASYGRVAYQTAYMKANYPFVYMASLLTADSGAIDKVAEIINECQRLGIPVLPPDINESLGTFTVVFAHEDTRTGYRTQQDASGIRFGLYSIKNVGEGIAETLIAERKKNGPYTSLANLLERISDRNLNKKSLEALIQCGAMDAFGERGHMLANLEDLLTYARDTGARTENQDSLFGLMEDQSTVPQLTLKEAPPATSEEQLGWEKELLGLYISGHPLEAYQEEMEKYQSNIETLKEDAIPGIQTVVIGVVDSIRPITTRRGESMAFLRISDMYGSMEAVLFPKTYQEYKDVCEEAACVKIRGTLSDRGGELSVLADAVKKLG